MGGHGGLNILPQKRWNVYNYDNREKVRADEEAAAKEEQLKREQSRKRDAEIRLEKLRQARGLSGSSAQAESNKPSSPSTDSVVEPSNKLESDGNHINLFEGIRILDPIKDQEKKEEKKGKFWREAKKVKMEEQVRTVGPEDEKYRMGHGVAGKGVKLPWYLEKKVIEEKNEDEDEILEDNLKLKSKRNSVVGKKSLEDLRLERLNREKLEKEREKALFKDKSRRDGGFSSRRR